MLVTWLGQPVPERITDVVTATATTAPAAVIVTPPKLDVVLPEKKEEPKKSAWPWVLGTIAVGLAAIWAFAPQTRPWKENPNGGGDEEALWLDAYRQAKAAGASEKDARQWADEQVGVPYSRRAQSNPGIGWAGAKTRLDTFFESYVRTALWSSVDDDGNPLDRKYTSRDFTKEALRKMRRDAEKFYGAHAEHIRDWEGRAGHDFWLTRNRHGAGFWDGDWPEPAASTLTEAARAFGEQDVRVSRGRLHVYP